MRDDGLDVKRNADETCGRVKSFFPASEQIESSFVCTETNRLGPPGRGNEICFGAPNLFPLPFGAWQEQALPKKYFRKNPHFCLAVLPKLAPGICEGIWNIVVNSPANTLHPCGITTEPIWNPIEFRGYIFVTRLSRNIGVIQVRVDYTCLNCTWKLCW